MHDGTEVHVGNLSEGVIFEQGLWRVIFGIFVLPNVVATFFVSFLFFFAVFAATEPDVLAHAVLRLFRFRKRRRRLSSLRRLHGAQGGDESPPEHGGGSSSSPRRSRGQEDLGFNSD
jgi:hypothetical protein